MKVELQPRFEFLSSIWAFFIALILVFVDKIFDWHISGLLFFTMIYVVGFITIVCKLIEKRAFRFGTYVVLFLVFFYLSVYYIFVPACSVGKFGGVLVFLVINVGFIILAGLELGVAVGIPELLSEATNIKLLQKIIMCISIVLIVISIVVLFFVAREMLTWAFHETYAEVIPEIGPDFMANLLNLIVKK